MKKLYLFYTLTIFIALSLSFQAMAKAEKSRCEMFEEMVFADLFSHIEAATAQFYEPFLVEPPELDTFSYEFGEIKHTGNHKYEVEIIVYPFVGAHNYLGMDKLVFEISLHEEIKLISYTQSESYYEDITRGLPDFQYKAWFKRPLPH